MCNCAAEEILAALQSVRAPAQPGEYDLHGMIASALSRAGIMCAHEFRLAPRCRIDFLCGSVGIEVKKGRPLRGALTKQVARYLESEAVSCVIVVMQRAVALPEYIGGKRVYVVSLNRLWGVALP